MYKGKLIKTEHNVAAKVANASQQAPANAAQQAPAARAPAKEKSMKELEEEARLRTAVEAELARRAPSATECGICCKSYADIAAASSSSASPSSALTAVLPCCHTVCRACVRQCVERQSVACPVCLTRFDGITSNENVDALPRNPFVDDAVHTAAHAQCSQCVAEDMVSEESVAVVRCGQCAKDLCDHHEVAHRRQGATKGHVLTHVGAQAAVAVDVCKTHGKALDTYCIDCKALVCLACTLKNGAHPSQTHHAMLLSEHLPTLTAALASAKKEAIKRQAEGVAQLVAFRTTATAADERGAALTSDVNRTIDVMVGMLQTRRSTLLEEVAKLTRAERAALEAAAGAEQLHWMSLQGGVSLTEQLLSTGSAPVRVGQLAHTASAHLVAAAGKSVGQAPTLEEMQLHVDPSVRKVLETVGTLKYLRAYGPKCTVDGEGLKAARIGKPATFVVTAISRSDERVRVGGDRVEASLHAGDGVAGSVCPVEDAGNGTYVISYTASALGAHQLHIRVNGVAVPGSPFAVVVSPASKTFTWAGSPQYDNHGILHHLATAGGTRPWTNPHDAGVVVVTGTEGKVGNSLSDFVNNAVGSLYVYNTQGGWLAVDLKGRKVVPRGYMLSTCDGWVSHMPRGWRFEGSNDGTTWKLLKAHANDHTFDGLTMTAYFAVPATKDNEAYSHFRVVLTGTDSDGSYYLVISCIELYGELLDP